MRTPASRRFSSAWRSAPALRCCSRRVPVARPVETSSAARCKRARRRRANSDGRARQRRRHVRATPDSASRTRSSRRASAVDLKKRQLRAPSTPAARRPRKREARARAADRAKRRRHIKRRAGAEEVVTHRRRVARSPTRARHEAPVLSSASGGRCATTRSATWDNSGEDNVLFLAGGIAFNLILAAVPFILLLITGATYLLPIFVKKRPRTTTARSGLRGHRRLLAGARSTAPHRRSTS